MASEVSEGEEAAVASGILEASVTSKVSEGSVVLEARPNQETRNLLGLLNMLHGFLMNTYWHLRRSSRSRIVNKSFFPSNLAWEISGPE